MAIDRHDPDANPGAPIKVTIAERQVKALTLRKQGASYRNIAEEMKKIPGTSPRYGADQAYRDVMAALHRLMEKQTELAKENLRLDLERLDVLFVKPYEMAKKGDLFAIKACLDILDRRAKLLGYGSVTQTALNLDVTKLSKNQLDRIINGEDPIIVLATPG
jgi:hypothetical protein